MRSLAAALLIVASATVAYAEDLDEVMTPEIARMAGEINAAVRRCGFKLRESELIFQDLPAIFYQQGRDDLVHQGANASLAFQSRYDGDPVGACSEARSRYGMAFE